MTLSIRDMHYRFGARKAEVGYCAVKSFFTICADLFNFVRYDISTITRLLLLISIKRVNILILISLQSGDPIPGDPRGFYQNDWQTGMCNAPCANPCWFCLVMLCPCPTACYVRRLSLGGEMSYYKCCQVTANSEHQVLHLPSMRLRTLCFLNGKGHQLPTSH